MMIYQCKKSVIAVFSLVIILVHGIVPASADEDLKFGTIVEISVKDKTITIDSSRYRFDAFTAMAPDDQPIDVSRLQAGYGVMFKSRDGNDFNYLQYIQLVLP